MFSITTTARFDRLAKALAKRHRKVFLSAFEDTLAALRTDPYNSTRQFAIKKLTDVAPGDGQYRIRKGRFRFRYDVSGKAVTLVRCSLRREDSYR